MFAHSRFPSLEPERCDKFQCSLSQERLAHSPSPSPPLVVLGQKRAPAHSIKHSAGRTIYFFLKLLRVSRGEAAGRTRNQTETPRPSIFRALGTFARRLAAAKFPAFEGVKRVSRTGGQGLVRGLDFTNEYVRAFPHRRPNTTCPDTLQVPFSACLPDTRPRGRPRIQSQWDGKQAE